MLLFLIGYDSIKCYTPKNEIFNILRWYCTDMGNIDLDSIRKVSWYLNFRSDEEISVKDIANETGIDFATTYNCITILEETQRLAPLIDFDENGIVTVYNRNEDENNNTEFVVEDVAVKSVLYIFVIRKYEKNIEKQIKISEHSVLEDLEDGVQSALKLGWLENVDSDTVRLTPDGIRIASSTYQAFFSQSD